MRFSFNNRVIRSLFGLYISCMLFFHASSVCYADVLPDTGDLLVGVHTDSNALLPKSDVELGDDNEENVEMFNESVLVPYLEDISGLVADIHSEIVPSEVSDQGQLAIMSLADSEISSFALDDTFNLGNNVLIYEGTFNGTSYRLVFPADYEQFLVVSEEGYLYNVSGSSVTGRLFTGNADFTEYEYSTFTLMYVLGNVASNIYNYGYPSYATTYYLSTSGSYDRITSTNTYGLFHVDNVVQTVSSDPVRVGNNYILILMMIGGMILLCCMKKSRH